MCTTCGCGHPEQVRIGEVAHSHHHDSQETAQSAAKNPDFSHFKFHSAQQPTETSDTQKRLLKVEQDVLGKNNQIATHNRFLFQQQHILALNLVSSPGSGKTTLLTTTLNALKNDRTCYVIEGDQQTENDADRIRATGVSAIQVNTGKGCHLDAQMINDALFKLEPKQHSLLFIENVGNLVCPSEFDLGEKAKVVILSVTEGEDKPLKYPHMFAASKLMILNKIDLLPYLNFDVEKCIAYAKQVNPQIEVIQLSATTGEGLKDWLNWLQNA
ncbi:hydrogenase nickel incorporation protein HypB [Aggregatibacter actinomycetemcomitans serotype e str. SC936]|uniref:hydrogenase nickel incorporation protein HypB n=1 Tax=Aggregatibacter actinomycetemcomitans TaxID=714 RepID=UPI00077E4F37|nr:hydrogenase nickel incorporation protein HypB [Aggregatibacter actinomycetemcomitans]KYK75013.1 hydrogenase nickel incorporation protein HypB [Aggregatibacter actinomycetemcomitans serotype e str. SA3096]KYK82057.1 hydrogenase nickel incorporation protein HypB [Aggregatibacter actinomycetemcomitans serotype e str. SC936]KYK95927.1 hydrogenase nickel incorporation protein HypB [Aggregatibacter actinomycetemcomitans serotype e str. ANH9776]TYB21912.1 hydrogenase nickel incorporation protein Hy